MIEKIEFLSATNSAWRFDFLATGSATFIFSSRRLLSSSWTSSTHLGSPTNIWCILKWNKTFLKFPPEYLAALRPRLEHLLIIRLTRFSLVVVIEEKVEQYEGALFHDSFGRSSYYSGRRIIRGERYKRGSAIFHIESSIILDNRIDTLHNL